MIERVLNGLLSLGTMFSRSRDPDIEGYRLRQRAVVTSGAMALGAMLLSLFVMPSAPDTTGYNALVAPVKSMLAILSLMASVLADFYFAWSSYRLWRFCQGHGR